MPACGFIANKLYLLQRMVSAKLYAPPSYLLVCLLLYICIVLILHEKKKKKKKKKWNLHKTDTIGEQPFGRYREVVFLGRFRLPATYFL